MLLKSGPYGYPCLCNLLKLRETENSELLRNKKANKGQSNDLKNENRSEE